MQIKRELTPKIQMMTVAPKLVHLVKEKVFLHLAAHVQKPLANLKK